MLLRPAFSPLCEEADIKMIKRTAAAVDYVAALTRGPIFSRSGTTSSAASAASASNLIRSADGRNNAAIHFKMEKIWRKLPRFPRAALNWISFGKISVNAECDVSASVSQFRPRTLKRR